MERKLFEEKYQPIALEKIIAGRLLGVFKDQGKLAKEPDDEIDQFALMRFAPDPIRGKKVHYIDIATGKEHRAPINDLLSDNVGDDLLFRVEK